MIAPDQLVLGSGGVLGDVWMTGVIAGLMESGLVDPEASGAFIGTSAGSIVATRLAVGQDLDQLIRRYIERPEPGTGTEPPGDLEPAGESSHSVSRLIAAHGATGRFIRRSALSLIPSGKQKLKYLERDMSELAPEWPARLNIAVFDSRSGSRVVLNREQGDGLSVSQAVQASCAIPAVFRPVESPSGARYVDGGVWSPVNLDAVPAKAGQTVVCLTPTGSAQGVMGLRRRATAGFFRMIVRGEVARLRRRGVRVVNVVPDSNASHAIGPSRMASGRESGVFEAALAQGKELASPLAAWLAVDRQELSFSP